MKPKKKSRNAPSQRVTGQLGHISPDSYQSIIGSALHRLHEPVTHINPAELSPDYLDDLLERARY